MSNIRMSPETMRTRAGEFNRDASDFEELHSRMKTRTENLAQEWEGQASQKYIQQFHDLEKTFTGMHELMQTIAQQLNDTARIMEETDQQIASKLGVQ